MSEVQELRGIFLRGSLQKCLTVCVCLFVCVLLCVFVLDWLISSRCAGVRGVRNNSVPPCSVCLPVEESAGVTFHTWLTLISLQFIPQMIHMDGSMRSEAARGLFARGDRLYVQFPDRATRGREKALDRLWTRAHFRQKARLVVYQ